MKKVGVKDRVYLAATLDCEGSISVTKFTHTSCRNDEAYAIAVEITNRSEELICWLVNTFDGSLSIRERGGNKSTLYVWTVRGKATAKILKLAFPYLKVKKRQAELAMKFAETISPDGKKIHRLSQAVRDARDEICKEMKLLNVRGSHA